MDVNIQEQDGDDVISAVEAPPVTDVQKQKTTEGKTKRKRRRGKSKRKVVKPYVKFNWQERRRNDKSKRDHKYRAVVLTKTHAPFNNNQFLMEIHKPEADSKYETVQTPSARTRDSSFSVDSEENYFYSLPEDEEDFLTKEFSSVYEDAQSERLSNMSKNDLIQEYLLLEAKYENLLKRSERSRTKICEEEKESTSATDRDSITTEQDTSGTSMETAKVEPIHDILARLKEQDDQILNLKLANEKLRIENEHLQKNNCPSSEDSESDSSSTSMSSSSSSCNSPAHDTTQANGVINGTNDVCNGQNGHENEGHVNGFSEIGSPSIDANNPD